MPKVAIVQFDNRSDADLHPLDLLIARNALYCRKHGYHHAFLRSHDRDIPVYWLKCHLMEEFLSAGFDIAVWLDTDAVIHDLEIPIESFFDGREIFVYSGDVPIWENTSPFNAGVFFCKGGQCRELMQDWLSHYPADSWEKRDNGWVCKDAVWAGPAYEQGCFVNHVLPRYRSTPLFKPLSWKVLQSPYPLDESFTLHFTRLMRGNSYVYLANLADSKEQAG